MSQTLSEFAAKAIQKSSGFSHEGTEMGAIQDELIRPFVLLEKQKAELEAIRSKPGKKPEVKPLAKKISDNKKVLEGLAAAVDNMKLERPLIGHLRQRQNDLRWAIRAAESEFSDDTRPYREAASKLGQSADNHPKVMKIRQEFENKKAAYNQEFSDLGRKIFELSNILAKFQG